MKCWCCSLLLVTLLFQQTISYIGTFGNYGILWTAVRGYCTFGNICCMIVVSINISNVTLLNFIQTPNKTWDEKSRIINQTPAQHRNSVWLKFTQLIILRKKCDTFALLHLSHLLINCNPTVSHPNLYEMFPNEHWNPHFLSTNDNFLWSFTCLSDLQDILPLWKYFWQPLLSSLHIMNSHVDRKTKLFPCNQKFEILWRCI